MECGARHPAAHSDVVQFQGGRNIALVNMTSGNWDAGTSTCQGAGGSIFYSANSMENVDVIGGRFVSCNHGLNAGNANSGPGNDVIDAMFRTGRTDGSDPNCVGFSASPACINTSGLARYENVTCQRWDPNTDSWPGSPPPPPPPSDTTPPTATMTAPANNSTVSGTIAVSANAADNVDIDEVQFRLDGANLGAPDSSSPYSISWNTTAVSNGSHSLTAVATDTSGNSTTASAISVTVNNVPPDTTAPAVNITAPANGATVSGTTAVSASASDNVGVAGVQFRLDGANLGAEDTSSPYSVSWNTASASEGSHSLTAVARDAAGNTTTSAAVNVTVDNVPPSDTTPPAVSMTAPANNATVSGSSVTVSANASDNVAVAHVQFRLDGSSLGPQDANSPYSYNWNTTTLANGPHTLTAIATDSSGNTATASSITVNVNNQTAPPPDTNAPGVPANLRSPATTTTTITLAWNASTDTGGSGLAGYRIYRNGSLLTSTDLLSLTDANLSPATSYSYRVSAYDNAGNESAQSAALNVSTASPPAAPTVSLNANPTTVSQGGSSTLTWSSTNATSCTASGGWNGSRATSGSQSTGALSSSRNFTLTCTGPGGSANASVTVTVSGSGPVQPPPRPIIPPRIKPWVGAGDLNNDGKVNILDLSILLKHYRSSSVDADVNDDGKVDILDLSKLLGRYGK
jgi:chitodextrinase